MNHNPYSSPNVASVDDDRKRSPICIVLFWVSCVLSLTMFGIAANGGYQYWLYTSQAGFKLPAHILAATICVACSGLGMLYSATRWRYRLIRAGAVWLVCSLLAFLVGPQLLQLLI